MKTTCESERQLKVAATLWGEDIACGEYVAVLTEFVDVPSFLWDGCAAGLSPHEPVRLKLIPDSAGQPLKVIAICLPFVYVKTPSGKTVTIDLRRTGLVRLDRKCAKLVWNELRSNAKQSDRFC